jgi:hypothetical protein
MTDKALRLISPPCRIYSLEGDGTLHAQGEYSLSMQEHDALMFLARFT